MADRDVTVRLKADISNYSRGLAAASAQTSAFSKSTDGAGKEIDRFSGRLRLAADAALILGPALAPLGAAAVGGVVALSAQLGALAGGLGVTLLAVNGLGDGLKALDKYQLEPTALNLKKLNDEMKSLGPAGEDFVRFLDSIEPNLKTLQNAAREGLLPGVQEGIEELMQRLPELRKLIRGMATTMGDLASDAGGALGGERFDAFFKYLRTDGIKILDDTSRTLGNLAEAAANVFVAFGGVSTDFSGGLLKFSEGLAEASANLQSNAGFQEFVDYISTEGPHALETLGSLANAFLQIVEAAAPLGGPVLTVLGKMADILATIADSDLGTPIFAGLAALALFNRSLAITASLQAATFGGPAVAMLKGYANGLKTVSATQQAAQATTKVELSQWEQLAAARRKSTTALVAEEGASKSRLANIGKGAAVVGGLALATSGLAEKTGLSNTASMALMGTIAGPWGAAIGGGIGLAMDLAGTNDTVTASLERMQSAFDGITDPGTADMSGLTSQMQQARAEVDLFQQDMDEIDWFGKPVSPGDLLKGAKNDIEGLFGMSDNEENQAALDDLEEQYRAVAAAHKAVADGIPSVTAPLAGLRKGMEEAAEAAAKQEAAIMGAVEAMHAMREEALRAANAELDYRASIRDANDALKENGKTVDKNTDKGEANLRALYNLAGAWNGQSEVIKGNSKALRAAKDNFVETAVAMGMNEDKAKRLARAYFDIPERRQTKITVETGDAFNSINELQVRLANIRNKDVYVRVHTNNVRGQGGPVADPGVADGGTIPGPRHPYGDKLTVRVAPGEEIISNRHGQADRFRRDRAAGRIPGYADGGTPGGGGGYQGDAFQSGQQLFAPGAWSAANALKAFAVELRKLQNALAKSEKALDKETQARDELASQAAAFSSQVGGAYSTADPFAMAQSSGSVWGAGTAANPLGSFDSALSGNIASTQAAQQALAFAQSHGLDGPLYAALAASGNLPLLQSFAQLSASEIDVREAQFAAQSNAQSALGASAAAGAGMTAALASADKHIIELRDEVKGLRRDTKVADANNQAAQAQNAKDVKDGVNGAAAHGHRRGH